MWLMINKVKAETRDAILFELPDGEEEWIAKSSVIKQKAGFVDLVAWHYDELIGKYYS